MNLSWDDLPFPFLMVDDQGQILAANARAAFELEQDATSLPGRDWTELLRQAPGDEAARYLGGKDQVVQLQSRTYNFYGQPCRVWTWHPGPKPSSRPVTTASSPLARILVAEDEDSIRDICRRVLTDSGYEVLPAANGQAAIDILAARGHEIDLILADVVMPVVGGEAIFEYLRSSELKMPVIYTSGFALRNSPAEFLENQGVTLLRKPYSLSQLLETVRGALKNE